MAGPIIRTIVIVGAGAMGCLFAARLKESGASVTLVDVARPRIEALQRSGITLADDTGTRTIKLPIQEAAEVVGPVDLVMLFTKGAHTLSAVNSIAHLAQHGTYALTLQNGLGNAENIAEVFAPNQILIGATDFPADLRGDTHVSSHGAGTIWLGSFMASDAATQASQAVATLFQRARLHTLVEHDVQAKVWEKAAFNAAMNTLTMVTGLRVGQIDTPAGIWIADNIVSEVVAAAAAHSIVIDRGRILNNIGFALANHRDHMPSMLHDRLAGRRTEIENINGALVCAGAAGGIAMPVTATMANLVRLIEAAQFHPPEGE